MINKISKEMNRVKFERALKFRDEGKNNEAIDLFNEILKSEPNNLKVYLLLGEIYLSIEEYKKSSKCFRKARFIKDDSELASLGLFHSLLELSDLDGAFKEMDRFLNDNVPNNYKVTLDEIYEQLDNISEKLPKDIVSKYYNLYCRNTEN